MSRVSGMLLVVVAGLLSFFALSSFFGWAEQGSTPLHAAPDSTSVPVITPRPGPSNESVRLHHEMVEVWAPAPKVLLQPARLRKVSREPRTSDSPRLVGRVSRALVGDGRYRPEPFPRPAAR